ncbi:MAG: monofunctional biosynthetic peptidoglycan transglycosylase [Candidatus Aminicenantes bacterium]|jgi:monofunctional biosynthetic peptidoglycan transglycosylase
MSEEKPKKPIKKIVLIALLGILLVSLLFVGYFFLSLPDVEFLKTRNPETTALIEQRKAEAKKKGRKLKIRQKWISFDDIPQLFKDTVRVSEDIDFYHHSGIDYYELKEAIKRNLKEGKKARGGSTITQQLAKNLFLSTKKSYYRKLREFFIAKSLEKYLSKNRIFHIYLNIIELGPGIFGVEAASEYYFGKPVAELELVEIIRLVSVLPKPLRVTPLSNSRYLKWRANLLLERLSKYEFITDEQYKYAQLLFR